MKHSIRTQLILAFIVPVFISLLTVGVVIGINSYQIQLTQSSNLEQQLAKRVQISVTDYIENLSEKLRIVAEIQSLENLLLSPLKNNLEENYAAQQQVLAQLLTNEDAFDEIVLLDRQGNEQIRISPTKKYSQSELSNRSQEDEFNVPVSTGKNYYSQIRFDESTGDPLMTIAVPLINNTSGLVTQTVVAEARIKKVWDLIKNIELNSGENIYIVDSFNRVVAHQNPSIVLQGTHFVLPKENGVFTGIDGTKVILATDRIEIGSDVLTSVAEKPLSEAMVFAINTLETIAITLVASAIITLVWGIMILRTISKPIEALANTARIIGKGDLSKRVTIKRQDEIGDLAQAFNEMADAVKKSKEQLEQYNINLENKVKERTTDLNNKMEELEKMNNLMIGRELKMVELKNELEDIKKKVS